MHGGLEAAAFGRRLALVFALVGFLVLSASVPAFARGASALRHAPKRSLAAGTSTNWSGYAVSGTSATDVIGTWSEPSVTCAAGENSWSSPWVGIDGDTSKTVEQIGTDSDCRNGTPTYYAWYEMYPKSLVVAPITVSPGDSLTGEVTYAPGGSFTLKLADNTHPAFYTTTQFSNKAQRTSVEWIMEGPSSGLLSDFSSLQFSAASATISGQTGGLGSFAGAEPITMVTSRGVTRALPSSISGGTAFGTTWEHS